MSKITLNSLMQFLARIPSYVILNIFLILIISCNIQDKNIEIEEEGYVKNPLEYVNPFLGTAPLTDPKFIGYTPPKDWRVWAGLTFPGSSLPNAMVQLSPITKYGSGAGYEYEDNEIIGFAHTNKGHWNLCNIPVLPVSQEAEFPFRSTFEKKSEKASPAFYQVMLKDYDVKVRLTSTLRTGFHEYTFNAPEDRRLVFDLGRSNGRVNRWELKKEGANQVKGYQQLGNEKIYFFAEVSDPIERIVQEKEKGYALLDMGSGNSRVTMKIALSFVSTDNAKENLKNEINIKEFESVHKEGKEVWNELLSKVQVSGGSEKQKMLFYSSLYRSFLWPALRSDYNGEFIDDLGTIRNEGFDYYTIPSLWDTYRNKLVLLTMLRPQVTGNVIQSLIVRSEISGFIPTFFHGDHAASFITNAYAQGIDNFDIEKAYKLLLNNAYKEGGTRPYLKEYIENGYISDPYVESPNVETKAKAGVSKTLEYAYDDYALAILSKAMNDTLHYNDLMKRSKNYQNIFDTKTHFMRGRLEGGTWISHFNPEYPYYEYMYREANAWQVSFYVPHDMQGLVNIYGGKEKFEEKLDSLFSLPWNPNHIARNVSSFIGQYCHGNQPDHESPYAYYFIGKPKKSQKIINKILNEYYGVGDSGLALPGMDDAGEMSSWYVFAATGTYPLCPADNNYLLSTPLFDRVKWSISGNENSLEIIKNVVSDSISERKNNIKIKEGNFVPFPLFKNGGVINIVTKNNTNY